MPSACHRSTHLSSRPSRLGFSGTVGPILDGYRTGMLRLHDTAEGRVVDIEPRYPGTFLMYVCGPTVYDVPHIGHGRFALVFDVLRRYLEWTGLQVTYVSNITDIEDNIIKRANEKRIPTEELT